ncbi:uncharacterized protein LOC110104431 [Dendrobium catenatum]|uniref:RING-type E3 ubiquitin transferase n=1 Tax=Dendrobium catenatum TaxID=906689 RepID=A0A2I0XGJ0_9ASPA|nr:uncharacterized protein LOC110104431 [Dendrobium catenatum]PKU87025.1 DNA repair protein RAD5 [Dendrobium catenatum]
MEEAGEIASPAIPQKRFKRSPRAVEAETKETILSPRFRSAAAMAGWDEEALLFATQVVEDTPVRESSRRRRSVNQLNSSTSSSSKRKLRSRRQPADPIPVVVLCLDDEVDGYSHQEIEMKGKGPVGFAPNEEKKEDIGGGEETLAKINYKEGLPCMDRLREELSCAICLEICYEPSTTSCGHSFCKKCLKCAADKCGKKCPKCRQLISNTRTCTVNTVLWNTIQLLFPNEVEPRKKAAIESSLREEVSTQGLELERIRRHTRSRTSHSSTSSFRSAMELLRTVGGDRNIIGRLNPNQSEDVALALRLQREEFLETFSSGQQRNSLYTTRARLRSMALGVNRMRNRSQHS